MNHRMIAKELVQIASCLIGAENDWHRVSQTFDSEKKASEIKNGVEAFGGLKSRVVQKEGKWYVEIKLASSKKEAFEHKSKRQLEDYLRKHPKADKSKHWVKGEKQEQSKPEPKPESKKEEPKPEPKKEEPKTEPKKEGPSWKSKAKEFVTSAVGKIKEIANKDVGKALMDFLGHHLGTSSGGSGSGSREFVENMAWNRNPVKLMNLVNSGFGMRGRR